MYSGMQQVADHSVNNIIDNPFLGKTNETYERYVFNTRKQKAHETVDDYISALCTLASSCNFCDCLKDSLLRDRIVLGIKNSSTRKRLLKEADLNLETCIAMCRATEATSPSQPVKAVTWTEDTTAVQAGSVSSGDQRPGKKQDFSMSLRRCGSMASSDEIEMSEVNFNTEMDDPDDSALQWTTAHQSSGFPRDRTEHHKNEPAWSMEEVSPDQPSAVYSTAQPMSDNTSLGPIHVCYLCSAAFVLVSSLELHLASVHGEKLDVVLPGSSTPDRCDAGICSNTGIDKELDSRSKRKTTMKIKGNGSGDKDGKKRSKQHVCDVCGKSSSNSGNLTVHKRRHTGEKPHVCPECGKGFTSSSDLTKHCRIHTGLKPHVCSNCGKGFAESSALKKHRLTHFEEKSHSCPHCPAAFRLSQQLKKHVERIHHSERPKPRHSGCRSFVCDVCGKCMTQARHLTEHKRIHTGERPYKCPHCVSDFKHSYALRCHIKSIHDGARPHLCDVCGAAFSQTCNLTAHKRIHTGEKPHPCPDCGKCFARSTDLKKHRRTHSGLKPHLCSECGKGFADISTLRRHRLTHSDEKPHSCPHCPSTFRLSQQLKKHLLRKHQ